MGQGQGREGIAPRATHSPRPRHQGQDRPHSPFGLPGIAGGRVDTAPAAVPGHGAGLLKATPDPDT